MASITPTDFTAVKSVIHDRHLEQLQAIASTEGLVLISDPMETVLPVFTTTEDVAQWTKDSMAQINKAKASRVYSGSIGSQVDFNNAFMAFMESATVYLRDTSSVVEAIHVLHSGRSDSLAEASRLLTKSTAAIDRIADMWGMQFIQICDLVAYHPDGHTRLVGPFCGAFVPKDIGGNNPYFGIAFKGTSDPGEWINDLKAVDSVQSGNWLWNTSVAEGFFYPLFSTYNSSKTKMPFVLIQEAAQNIMSKVRTSAVAHVTGHSLGGAYATLTYAQLCNSGFGRTTAPLHLGDMYTYGAPRSGHNDLAKALKAAQSSPHNTIGSTWRIVNKNDYVPRVPFTLNPWNSNPFVHVDAGMLVEPNAKPSAIDSEIDTHPWFTFPHSIGAHYTSEYYKSLTFATTSRGPRSLVRTQRGVRPLTVFANRLDSYSISLVGVQLHDQEGVQIALESNEDTVDGTIKAGRFIGELTALGSFHGVLDGEPTFACSSWRKLFSAENQCVFQKQDGGKLAIYFIIDDEVVAHATVTGDADDAELDAANIVRGSCTWSLNAEDPAVEQLSAALANTFASIFAVEPTSTAVAAAA